MRVDSDFGAALGAVGPRLRALRRRRETTLASLSAATGISVSTLSRLESGDRKPTLELLLPLARAHGVTLDELAGAPPTGDPGEAAELDTRVPHWFGPADDQTVELLSRFGRQGEHAHLRARAARQRP